ncbi:FAD/NAD(P)-binding domain-containing protein [Daedalea quercina L-15889]|uniref:FAD/NAD(P)-binding domain-containing protein n=1 Tax=Daedalea quercina L-15889 TaxID=1314783 RepID=A0A165N923_9APHY|nr:FAD/NAD(P)-binding domain-containing protein [Daedalea quercina L-15889]
MASLPDKKHVRTLAIVGAGPGGIMMGIALKHKLGLHDFVIYDKSSDFGGTWLVNSYPGSASDTPAHFFTPSTHLNPHWSTTFPPQPELLAYWHDLASRYTLYSNAAFYTRVIGAQWNCETQRYDIELEDVRTGQRRRERAQFVVSATGLVSEPRYPEAIAGLGSKGESAFEGAGGCWHSARWRHDVDFHARRVAVIGNSASAAQFVPCLAADPTTQVVNFGRTTNWFVYGPRHRYPSALRWVLAHIPLALRLFRLCVILINYGRPIWLEYRQRFKSRGKEGREADLIAYMKRTAPEQYHEMLTPTYPLSCRRPILDAGYYACLHNPNIELSRKRVCAVTKTGLRLEDGTEEAFDVIILSTGFVTGRSLLELRGEDGVSLNDFWKSEGRPMAHRGVCVPGFPNFFLIAGQRRLALCGDPLTSPGPGPNTVTRNGSAILTHEVAVNYIAQLLAPLIRSPSPRPLTLRVPPAAFRAFNARIAAALAASGFAAAACPPSWFRADGGTGANFSTWPGSIYGFWWAMRRVRWEEYEVREEAGRAVDVRAGRRWEDALKWALGVAVLVGAGVGWWERARLGEEVVRIRS